jgi:hypothetical protein
MNLEQITSLFYCFDSCWSRRPDQGQDAILPIELHCCHVQTIFMFCSKEQNSNLVPCWYRSNYLQVASFQHHDIGAFFLKNLMKTSSGIWLTLWQNCAGTMQGSAFTPVKFNAVFSALPISGSWKLQQRDLWLLLQCGWVDSLAQRGYKAWWHRTVLGSEEDSDMLIENMGELC